MIQAIKNWFSSEDPDAKLEVTEFEAGAVAETLTALKKDFDELKATHAGQLAAKAEKLKAAEARATEFADSASTSIEELTNLKAKHAEEIEAERTSVKAKVESELANLGVDPVPVLKDGPQGEKAIKAQYAQIDITEPGGAEKRREFRRKHKAVFPGG